MDVVFHLCYTRSDPTQAATTDAIESLGGHIGVPNNGTPIAVYEGTTLSESISYDDTSILVSSSPDENSGLFSINGDISRYAGYDTAENEITGITRGLSLETGLPAPRTTQLYYLNIDRLFGENAYAYPVYRCVGLYLNTVAGLTDNGFFNLDISLHKDIRTSLGIDIGLEIPKWPSIGSQVTAASPDDTTIIDASLPAMDTAYQQDDYFVGGHIAAQIGGSWHDSLITGYDGSIGAITIDTPMPILMGKDEIFRIWPAPSQVIPNEETSPGLNGGRFIGFYDNGGSSTPYVSTYSFRALNVVYIWIKKTAAANQAESSDTFATISVDAEINNIDPNSRETFDYDDYVALSGTVMLSNKGDEPIDGITIRGIIGASTYETTSDTHGRYTLLTTEKVGNITITAEDLPDRWSADPAAGHLQDLAEGHTDGLDFVLTYT